VAAGKSESPHLLDAYHHDQGHSHGHNHSPAAGQGHAHTFQDLSIGLAVLGKSCLETINFKSPFLILS
jgi:hypothetical protein